MLRRLKEDVMQDLPPKIIQDFACKMTPIQVSFVLILLSFVYLICIS